MPVGTASRPAEAIAAAVPTGPEVPVDLASLCEWPECLKVAAHPQNKPSTKIKSQQHYRLKDLVHTLEELKRDMEQSLAQLQIEWEEYVMSAQSAVRCLGGVRYCLRRAVVPVGGGFRTGMNLVNPPYPRVVGGLQQDPAVCMTSLPSLSTTAIQ
ncbi:hypothetical protein HaLaN_12403 [Haematococcus lacustris]|uniref:Uncharacterized protein n=1 Tax=Haematococcus lacustris TaxID=44745 RepID=A0A699Z3A0_HAELA|nr:hypothetical protein HaLaN_12403 [Haematococcus lacustris]